MKIRGVVSEKGQLSRKVIQIANTCKSLEELSQRLEENLITPYSRNGKLTGLWFGNRKFRFTTLGVGKQHLKQLTKEQERLDLLTLLRARQSKGKELEI
ncbi:hypothetical protein KCTC32516_00538 [Polaribacter huanghezhanensis]|uniref:hypothetical protein n=1 Tax=Polaribacter huanghezhanensis TaxID=1354726 RepID=UPI002647BC43|nr:hypothetical protein [Polaribacter huanghezhanensis]WKD85198.1 hypothetical protein KCTC32516_00538 [Polaribacter huanghezhanensis]